MAEKYIQSTLPFLERARVLGAHFANCLLHTPLLLGWLLTGLLVTLLLDGWTGLGLALINLVLTGLYVLLIRKMTPDAPPPLPVKRPRLELAIAMALIGLFLILQLFDFGVWNIQPWQGWVRGFFAQVRQWVFGIRGLPSWAQQDAYLAVSSTIKQLIPTLLVFVLLRYRRHGMGLAQPHWRLSAALVMITTLFGLISGLILSMPLSQLVGMYLVGIFINALPEELFFRGFLLPRLEKVFAYPLNALVVSALLFNAMHIPIEMSNGASLLTAILNVFSNRFPTGMIWGYVYLRTRSILPGMFWHAANGQLGFILMDF